MKKRAPFFLLLTFGLLVACTIEPQGGDVAAEFHEPFTYQPWKKETLTGNGGQTACAVSSGHNGLTFVLRKTPEGTIVSVQSNRWMPAGTWMTVTVNGHRYESSQPYFSARDAVAMAEDFSQRGKAYMEASELRGYNGRVRYSNIIKLANFKRLFEDCRNNL